jgi:hypothetical protein
MRSFITRLAVLTTTALPMFSWAAPVTIDYELSALAQPSRYLYNYTVTNTSLGEPLGEFSLDFNTALYGETTLRVASSTSTQSWAQQFLGSVLGSPVQFDAFQTQTDGLPQGQSQNGFAVEFTWLGAGKPGAQFFQVYDPISFDVLASGLTTASAVPELPISAMLLLGLGCVAGARQFSQRRS